MTILVGVVLLLTGCESMGRLKPINDVAATTTGPLEAHFTTVGTSNGDMVVMLPGRKILQGHYDSKNRNFGSVFSQVYGPGSENERGGDEMPCAAVLTGPPGLSMECEFYNNGRTNRGYGACRSSTGALYKLTY